MLSTWWSLTFGNEIIPITMPLEKMGEGTVAEWTPV